MVWFSHNTVTEEVKAMMTSSGVKEYAHEIRKGYLRASKKEKSQLPNEFVTVTSFWKA